MPDGVAATEARTQSKSIRQTPTETSASTVSAATAPSLSSNSDGSQSSGVEVNGNANISNSGVSDSGLVDDLAVAKPSSEVHGPQPSGVNVDGNGNPDASANVDSDGSLVGGDLESEPLYAIEFSVAPPREGEQPSQLLAEVSAYTAYNGLLTTQRK